MTQEIKQKLKQAAETAWEQDQKTNPSPVNPHAYVYGHKAGAQTVLENPSGWGLVNKDSIAYDISNMESQLAKYREALERIYNSHNSRKAYFDAGLATNLEVNTLRIAKEALKQEGTTCPKCGYPLFKHLGKACCQGCDYVKQQ